jgi:triacylglycerol lipase
MNFTPVLLLHGFFGSPGNFDTMKEYLERKGRAVEYHDYYYPESIGQKSFIQLADELAAYVRKELEGKKFSVIAFSQGGILFRTLAMQYPELVEDVEKVVTICTPHYGSLWAAIEYAPGITDLKPGSELLKTLNAYDDRLPYYAVYNTIDEVVVPGVSAKFERAKEVKEVSRFMHHLTLSDPDTLSFVDDVLFQEK